MSNFEPPVGYNPIEKIRGGLFHWIAAPFNGVEIWVKVRCLNHTELRACGDTSLIDLKESLTENSLDDIIGMKNYQEALCRESLVYPRFDEIIKVITGTDIIISEHQNELKSMRKEIEVCPDSKRKKDLQKEIDRLELALGFMLPDDFMAYITSWAMGIDRTDIKKITRGLLLEAAIMAKNGGDNPADHIIGVFTDFQREDINKNAWIVYNEYVEEKQKEEKLNKKGFRIIGGKKPKKR